MTKYLHPIFVLVMIVAASFVFGCTGSMPRGVNTPADADRAFNQDTRECDPYLPGVTERDFRACERLVRNARGKQPTANAESAPTNAAPAPAYAAPATPMVMTGATVVPTAVGSSCEAPEGTPLTIYNNSNLIIEVQSDYVFPLSCDAPSSMVPALVGGGNGVPRPNMVIPPHTVAQFVIGYKLNAYGVPQQPPIVQINYAGYTNLGPMVPAPFKRAIQRPLNLRTSVTGFDQRLDNGDFVSLI